MRMFNKNKPVVETMSQINLQEINAIRVKIEISSVKNYLYYRV